MVIMKPIPTAKAVTRASAKSRAVLWIQRPITAPLMANFIKSTLQKVSTLFLVKRWITSTTNSITSTKTMFWR